jgi:serine/threonine-protein kinase HipA
MTLDHGQFWVLYDSVTTRAFPNLKHDRMALKLNGKDDNLRHADFKALAATAGIRAGDADGAIDELVQRLVGAVERIALPTTIDITAEAEKMVEDVLEICRARLVALA